MIMFQPLIFMGVQDKFFTVDGSEIRRKRTSWGKGSLSTSIYDVFFTSQVVLAGFLNRQQ